MIQSVQNKLERFSMPNSPENYSFITYVWVMALAILGGTVRTLTSMTVDMGWRAIMRRWIVDIIVSIFVGFVTFFLCQFADFDMMLTIALVSISAHMGTRAIVLYEERVYEYFKKKECDDAK